MCFFTHLPVAQTLTSVFLGTVAVLTAASTTTGLSNVPAEMGLCWEEMVARVRIGTSARLIFAVTCASIYLVDSAVNAGMASF